jgi:hypothetical protein
MKYGILLTIIIIMIFHLHGADNERVRKKELL